MVELAMDPHFSQALRKGPNQPFLASLFSSKPACVPLHAELPEILHQKLLKFIPSLLTQLHITLFCSLNI